METFACEDVDIVRDMCLYPKYIAPYAWRKVTDNPEIKKQWEHEKSLCEANGLHEERLKKCKALFPDAFSITYWTHDWGANGREE